MLRRLFLLGWGVTVFSVLIGQNTVFAQVIAPGLPIVPKIQQPNFGGFPPELQKELQRLIDQAALQQQQFGRGIPQAVSTTIRWGGLRLKKVTGPMQEQLGLPDNEGLIVLAVDPNSSVDKAGVKASDILVKINNKRVPNDFNGFAKLVKDQDPGEALELTVVRKGKEEVIKEVRMPASAQTNPGSGGLIVRPGLGGAIGGILVPRINPNIGRMPNPNGPKVPAFPNPLPQGTIQNLELEMSINGAKVIRKQTNEQFSGEYAKDNLKITVAGKMENGQAKVGEIVVQEGMDSTKFATLNDVPATHRTKIQQLLLPTSGNPLGFPLAPNIQGLPNLPNLDDA